MAALTDDMKDVFGKCRPYVLATSSRDGIPNAVPMGSVRLISDEEILIADNFMYKTRKNLEENPEAAVSFWSSEVHYGYQLKGKARVETSGELLEEQRRIMKERGLKFTSKAVVIITVEEAYYIGANKDSSKNLLA